MQGGALSSSCFARCAPVRSLRFSERKEEKAELSHEAGDACPSCGGPMPEQTGAGRPRVFCTIQCGKDFHNKKYRSDVRYNLLHNAKKRAKNRNLDFTITKDDIVVPEKCPILGIPLKTGRGARNYIDTSPSLDRINNSLGYTPGNVQVISMRANRLKNDATPCELEALIRHLKEQGEACVLG